MCVCVCVCVCVGLYLYAFFVCVCVQLTKLQDENDNLVGKHSKTAQQLQNEDINLPNNLEVCLSTCSNTRMRARNGGRWGCGVGGCGGLVFRPNFLSKIMIKNHDPGNVCTGFQFVLGSFHPVCGASCLR